MKDYVTIAQWPVDGHTWSLRYLVTQSAWQDASLYEWKARNDFALLLLVRSSDKTREISSSEEGFVIVRYPGSVGHIYENRSVKNQKIGPINVTVIASAWFTVMGLRGNSHSLRGRTREMLGIRRQGIFSGEENLKLDASLLELSKTVSPVWHVDHELYSLLGIDGPWRGGFDDFVEWHKALESNR